MKASRIEDFPVEYLCRICQSLKPIADMLIVRRRREKDYYLRPVCKSCHNERERGHRREWKRQYLLKWRKKNAALNESYWRNDSTRERQRVNAYKRFGEKHDALLIQGRMRRHDQPISIAEAEQLLKKFGRCYPTAFGLTAKGKKECERIRSALRRRGAKKISMFEIRLMVYDDDRSNFIKPERQKSPYQNAASKLRKWHHQQRQLKSANNEPNQTT